MVEAELLIGHLRNQVRHLQSLLHYLEARDAIESDDYSYSSQQLRELITRLRELERFSLERGTARHLQAEWLN